MWEIKQYLGGVGGGEGGRVRVLVHGSWVQGRGPKGLGEFWACGWRASGYLKLGPSVFRVLLEKAILQKRGYGLRNVKELMAYRS